MKRILHINTVFDKGGAAKIARFLHYRLNQTGKFESHFAYGRGKRSDERNTFKFSLTHETYQNYLISLVSGYSGYGSGISTARLISHIEKKGFDIIHLHNIHGHYLNIGFIDWLKSSKIKTVWTLHDGWALTGRCAYLSQCGERWMTGCGKCPDLSLYPKSMIDTTRRMWKIKKEKTVDGWEPHIVVPSDWLAQKVSGSMLNGKMISVIYNSIDTNTFSPKDRMISRESLKIDKDKFVILFIASNLNDKLKGMRYFFECLKMLDERNIVVVTAGNRIKMDGPLNCELIQLGYVNDRGSLAELYSAADVFCTTSLDEVFGLTVTESLSCGTPVIGFASGGIKEQVGDDCGMLVEPGDVNALSRIIKDVSADKAILQNLKKNCRNKALMKYSEDLCFEKYRRLYESL
jgi:glycosyltransferase involved in cell wall biosynthesis